MIARSYILTNLKTLDRKYNRATSTRDSLFYSKLAILELCGWIEESMDDIVLRCACRHLTDRGGPRNLDSVISGSFASPTPSDGGDTEE